MIEVSVARDVATRSSGSIGSWRAVSRFLIRSAGFPFHLVELGGDAIAVVCQRRVDALIELRRLQERWPACFAAAVARLERAQADRAMFKAVYRARRDVLAGRRVGEQAAALLDAEWVRDWQRSTERLLAAELELDEAVRRTTELGRTRLRMSLSDPRFAAAVTAGNPELLDRLIATLSADPTGSRSATRQDERAVYAYAQRLATKNETISFFGPIDYGALGGDRTRISYAGVPVQQRRTRLSYWPVQLIAEHLAADPAVAARLPLRLRAGLAYAGDSVLLVATSGRRLPLRSDQAAAVERVWSGGVSLASLPADLVEPARNLLARKVFTCAPVVPTALDDPLRWLRDLLAELVRDGVSSAAPWLALAEKFASQAASVDLRDADASARLAALEAGFTEATGQPARRGAGQHYADRLLVTEDCGGGVVDCTVSEPDAEVLTERLAPTLRLCASFSLLMQRVVRDRALVLHARLARQGPVSYLRLVAELDASTTLREVLADPRVTAWSTRLDTIVDTAEVDGEATVDPAALHPLCTEPPPGLVVSPDIFLCSDVSTSDMRTVGLVVGEIHHGAQVWSHLSVLDPDPARTEREVATVTGAGGSLAALLCRRTQGKAFEREIPGPVVPFRAVAAQHHDRVLPAETLLVRVSDDDLVLTASDGSPVRLHSRHPRSPSNWLFGPPPVVPPTALGDRPVAPRVVIGDVVAWRRRWQLTGARLGELVASTEPAKLVRAAASLCTELGLPRLVFAKAATARKPVFADLRCPFSLAHLAHYVRGSATVQFSEMLPRPEQWWLRPAGQPVSCEWRLTFGWTGDPPAGAGWGRNV